MRPFATLALLLASALALPARAADLSPRQRALVTLRVLVYDRNLRARAGSEVRIAVAYRPGNAASEQERDAMVAAFAEVAQRAVAAGLPVSALPVPFEDGSSFTARLSKGKAVALYACTGLEPSGQEVARAARGAGALAVAASRTFVEQGFAVALVDRGERAGLLIDESAAVSQGADLDSALLAIAELVGKPGKGK